ncbi:hypothetical protein AAUPMB_01774 [Pasteurella multocida subsp. multocida str. Anand1_buffalo]|nr:hypothetical protein AAUPMB_01774 [Pasteurella multocida subsp. multocida str. Anand1_buffalo]
MIKFTELLKPENIRQGLICSSKNVYLKSSRK